MHIIRECTVLVEVKRKFLGFTYLMSSQTVELRLAFILAFGIEVELLDSGTEMIKHEGLEQWS